jgi:hypothetical protein
VGFLRVLGFAAVVDRGLGQVVGAEVLGDVGADLLQRLVRKVGGVGAHVSDEADGAAAGVDTLI